MRNCLVYALTIAVIGAFASVYGYSPETMAFYPFADGASGASALGTATIKNAVDASLYPADAVRSTASAYGEVNFDSDAPGKYVFDRITGEIPTPICTDPGSVWITGRKDATYQSDGGYVSFKGLAGAFAKQLATNGEGTFEFFLKIPSGEIQREWTRGMMLYGGYTCSGSAYDHLFVIAPFTASGSYCQRFAFCYDTWNGSVLTAPTTHNNEWHHLAVVYKDGKFQMFYDYTTKGDAFVCAVANPADPSALAYEIGCGLNRTTGGNNGWRGKVSCLKFTAKALAVEEFLHVSEFPHYYEKMPEKLDLGAETIAFYPFNDGVDGASTVGEMVFDAAHPGLHFGTTKLGTGAGSVRFSSEGPGPYVFTNFIAGSEAIYTNPASIKFEMAPKVVGATTNWGSGNIDFTDLATELSTNAQSTVEFFWRIPPLTENLPDWRRVATLCAKPADCVGEYHLWLPLTHTDENRAAVWMGDYGDFEQGQAKRITFNYPDQATIHDDRWHHFALTYSNGTYRMYCDYQLGANQPQLPQTARTASIPMSIGLDNFHGFLSCLKVTARALQPSEMLHVSSRSDCMAKTGATLRWRFEEGIPGSAMTSVSNALPAYSDANPDVYLSQLLPRGDGVAAKASTGDYPVADASVWKKVIREDLEGRIEENSRSIRLATVKRAPAATFADGSGFDSRYNQLVGGSFTAELFAKLDYPTFLDHVISVSPDRPRVALLCHAIPTLNNGAWNLYLDKLTTAPVVKLALNCEGNAAEEPIVLTSPANETLRYKWHHYAVVYDEVNLTVALYLDGEKVAEKTDLPARLRVREGSNYALGHGGNCNAFDGQVDEVRVSDSALTPDGFIHGRSDMGLIMLYRPKK